MASKASKPARAEGTGSDFRDPPSSDRKPDTKDQLSVPRTDLRDDAIIDKLFARFEARVTGAETREDLKAALLDLHGQVARHHAEAQWLKLSEMVSAGTISLAEFNARFEAALYDLFKIVGVLHEKYGLADQAFLRHAHLRIVDAYFDRVDDVAQASGSFVGSA